MDSESDRTIPETAKDAEFAPVNPWLLFAFVLAVGLSWVSLIATTDTWQDVIEIRRLNFLVVGPLWAVTAILFFKGKTRFVLGFLALLMPATALSTFQYSAAKFRFASATRESTIAAMTRTLSRVQNYAMTHHAAPCTLTELADEAKFGKAVDAWGNELQYSIDRNGVISLTSLGADGLPGGIGKDADIVMRNRTRKTDGTLDLEDGSWISRAEVK